jgi:hypothetical protein
MPGQSTLCIKCRGVCVTCGARAYKHTNGSFGKWCSPCRRIAEARETCAKCGQDRGDSSHPGYCRICYRASAKSAREKNLAVYALKDRRQALKRKYGMTLADFDRILASQGGGCAVCNAASSAITTGPRGAKTGLHVDHDHACCPGEYTCGECIRGILCQSCNNVLGRVKDNPATLRALAAYLESWAA